MATVYDLRSMRVPNWLTLPSIVGGLLVNWLVFTLGFGPAIGLTSGLLASLVGGLLLAIVFGLLAAIHFVGMGDVKLVAAVGTLIRWPLALWTVGYVALAGGVLAVTYAVVGGHLGAVLRNLGLIARRMTQTTKPEGSRPQLHPIPYAAAILIGSSWAIVSRYVPSLRLW